MTAGRSRRSGPRSAKGSTGPLAPDQTKAWVQTYGRHARIYAWGFFALVLSLIFGLIWWEMGEVNDDVLHSFAFAATVTFLLARWSRKTATQGWTGVVEDMPVKEGQAGDIAPRSRALIRTRSGKRLTLRLPQTLDGYFAPGDVVFKIAGLDWPEKAELDSQERVCLACGNLYDLGAGQCPRCRAPEPDHATLVQLAGF